MIFFSLSIIFLSASWYALSGFYFPTTIHHAPPVAFSAGNIFISVIFNILYFRKLKKIEIHKSFFLMIIPCGLCAFFLPMPYNIAFTLCVAGLILAFLFLKVQSLKFCAIGITFTGIVCGIQSLCLPVYRYIFSHFHRADFISPVMSVLLKIIGFQSTVSNGELILQSNDKVYSFISSWDIMALFSILTVFIGSSAGLLISTKFNEKKTTEKIRLLLKFIFILSIYMIIRYMAVILIFLNKESVDVFWKLNVMLITFVPLAFILSYFFKGLKLSTVSLPSIYPRKSTIIPIIITIVFTISIVGLTGFHDPGKHKSGRILIDESHSNWEWTNKKFDTKWYGNQSTYNYYCLADYLNKHYWVEQNTKSLTESMLINYDILIIKTPTEFYSDSEIQVITEFVKNGGGLFLIGDHTNVFGVTTHLNPIADQFGLRFNYDGQYDVSGELSVYKKPHILPHPVVQKMPPFLFATGCTMDAPLFSDYALIGYGLKSVYLDYSQKNFFPSNVHFEETIRFGLFLQAGGVKFGKGRVLGFTDSTVWSNFFMFIPGKPELLLGCIEWLNRENSILKYLNIIFLIIGTICSIVLYKYSIKNRLNVIWFVITTLLCLPFVIKVFEINNSKCYKLPRPRTEFKRVNFEFEHSVYEMPVIHLVQNHQRSLSTFYVWLQRLGYVPALMDNFQNTFKEADVVVIANPQKNFKNYELEQVKKYVHGGGNLLVIVDPYLTNNFYINELLNTFDMSILPFAKQNQARFSRIVEGEKVSFIASNAGSVIGGNSLLHACVLSYLNNDQINNMPAQNEEMDPAAVYPNTDAYLEEGSAFSIKKYGDGQFAVLACFDLFSNTSMGTSMVIPNENQKAIAEFEYWIFQRIFGLGAN